MLYGRTPSGERIGRRHLPISCTKISPFQAAFLWWIWIFSVFFLFFNAHVFHNYLWLPFFPLVMLLVVGTKLQGIITKMCLKSPHVVRGPLLVKPNDNLFWSCFHKQKEDIIIRLAMGVVVQILCGYVTLFLSMLWSHRNISGRWVMQVLVDLALKYIMIELVIEMLHHWLTMMILRALRFGTLSLFSLTGNVMVL